jgi:DNA-binding transcriptional ArsR family regulator
MGTANDARVQLLAELADETRYAVLERLSRVRPQLLNWPSYLMCRRRSWPITYGDSAMPAS